MIMISLYTSDARHIKRCTLL